jgi:hypothetical protein
LLFSAEVFLRFPRKAIDKHIHSDAILYETILDRVVDYAWCQLLWFVCYPLRQVPGCSFILPVGAQANFAFEAQSHLRSWLRQLSCLERTRMRARPEFAGGEAGKGEERRHIKGTKQVDGRDFLGWRSRACEGWRDAPLWRSYAP